MHNSTPVHIEQLLHDEKVRALFVEHGVIFDYPLGSRAKDAANKQSDADPAFFLSQENPKQRFERRLTRIGKLSAPLHAQAETAALNDSRNNYLLADILREEKSFSINPTANAFFLKRKPGVASRIF